MMNFSGDNRGYGFVTYTTPDDAHRAVKYLNNKQVRRGRYIGVCMSINNCRLFIGGIPKNISRNEIYSEIRKVSQATE